jgi:hypothetical protein
LIIFGLVEIALLFTGKRLGDRFAGTRVCQR